MADLTPIEIPIEEAMRLVEPESLADALESLKSNGFIAKFRIQETRVLVWPISERKLEAAFISESLDQEDYEPKPGYPGFDGTKRRTRQ